MLKINGMMLLKVLGNYYQIRTLLVNFALQFLEQFLFPCQRWRCQAEKWPEETVNIQNLFLAVHMKIDEG